MNALPNYCLIGTKLCMTMAEWGVFWQATGVVFTVIFGSFGLYKIYKELIRLNEQRQKEVQDQKISAKLKRTEFFLNQHRRLFDNEALFSILSLIDSDSIELSEEKHWDNKRKFLTFLEEISLLVYSEQIDKQVAFYMFGYYSQCVIHGKNFSVGINPSEAHWGLLYRFSREAKIFIDSYPDGPPENISL